MAFKILLNINDFIVTKFLSLNRVLRYICNIFLIFIKLDFDKKNFNFFNQKIVFTNFILKQERERKFNENNIYGDSRVCYTKFENRI